MKVTFIQPYYHNVWEALGIGYIASYCKMSYYSKPFTMNFFQETFDDADYIVQEAAKSDIVGFSTTSPTFDRAVAMSLRIKAINPKVHCVFGGWHTTAMGKKCLQDGVDQIVIGEGEDAFLHILYGNRSKVMYGSKLPMEDLYAPDRDLIQNDRTISLCESMNGQRTASFQANRGCPIQCAFCSECKMSGRYNSKSNPIRRVGIHDLCNEIRIAIEKYDLTYFKFVDATFDSSAQYVIDLCKYKINMGIDTEWEAMIHANFATKEMFEWLRKANCNQVNIGCESGSDKILKDIGKGVSTDKIAQVFEWAKEEGVKRRAFFLLGMPNETQEDVDMTEAFVERIDPDVVGFTILCPYPGCKLYNSSLSDTDWANTDEYSNDFWSTEHFTNEQLKATQKRLTDKFDELLCERQTK